MKKFYLLAAMAMFGLMLTLTGCGRSDSTLTADACPLVEETVFANTQVKATCTRLTDIKKTGENQYSAVAEVTSNGKTEMLKITISYIDDKPIVIVF